ncbi:hypothetical protein DRQ18_06735 [bacterium]|nr:MAG: hypothetical protein DRQ18_06735 [bacterium]
MGVAPARKVTLVFYRGIKEELLSELQDEGILHIEDLSSHPFLEEHPELRVEEPEAREYEEKVAKLERAIQVLSTHKKLQSGLLAQFIDLKTEVSPERYARTVKDFDWECITSRVIELEKRKLEIKTEEQRLSTTLERLKPWKDLPFPPGELEKFREVVAKPGIFPLSPEEIEKALEEVPCDFLAVGREGANTGGVVFYRKEDAGEVRERLLSLGFEEFDAGGIEGTIGEEIEKIEKKLRELAEERERIEEEERKLSDNLLELAIVYDYMLTALSRKKVLERTLGTESVYVMEGWVLERDKEKLEKILKKYPVDYTFPETEAEGPVKLENRGAVRFFEVLTELYGLPHRHEPDPSPLMAPFFSVFFAFCLTDAFYGLILLILSLYLIRKIPEGERFLKLLAIGGGMTVIAGALTGGWFGNLHDLIKPFTPIREKLMWFDPFEDPLRFFALSLVFGIVQIFWGLGIGAYTKIKRRMYLDALGNEIGWLLFWTFIFIGALFMVKKNPGVAKIFMSMCLIPAIFIVLFGWRSNAMWKQILKGCYSLYSGFFGFIGDVLSYSRIMALGMVTAGIAFAVNMMVQLVKPIPVVGFILGFLIFVGGHLFSIAINVLGAFVHTLRLQYVEFFRKFYEGGATPWRPLTRVHRFTYIKKEVESG